MSICASGASTTKPNVPASVVVDGNYVKSLLPNGWQWLYDYLPYMQAIAIGDVGAFCALDPPSWTLPSTTDLFQFLTGGFVGQNDVVTEFLDKLVRSYLWYSLCECSSGTTPTPSAPPATPTGLPSVNPGNYVTSPVNACAHIESPVSTNPNNGFVWISTLIPFTESVHGTADTLYPVPTGATSAVIVGHAISAGSSHDDIAFSVQQYNAAGTGLGGATWTVPIGTKVSHTQALLPTAVTMQVWSDEPSGFTDQSQATMDIYCGGANPGGQSTPCCPPDPIASGLLRQVLGLVTLIQRQSTPFAYVTGPTHTGLTGTGTVSVSGILALAAHITTLPTPLGREAGTPERLFSAGWLNLGTPDGYEAPIYLSAQDQLVVPRSGGLVTTVGYSLHSGVVMDLVELIREP